MNLRTPAILLAATAVAAAHGQSSFQGLYEGVQDGGFTSSDFNVGDTTAASPFTVSRDFTGMDRSGATRTMNVSGSAFSNSNLDGANRHAIHISGQGTVTNAYYNENNRPVIDGNGAFDPTGSPYQLAVHGNAGYSDTINFTGRDGEGYTVDFLFQLEGLISGDTEAGLNFSTSRPSDPGYYPRLTRVNGVQENVGMTWATPAYPIQFGTSFDIHADMYAGLTTNLIDHADGSTIGGSADYGDTLTLGGIEIRDPQGNLVTSGITVSSTSGASYNPVPEPSALAALGLGALALLRRRK